MGFNTSVLVLNDSLGAIEKDPEFGMKLSRAISESSLGKKVTISSGYACQAAEVVETHHNTGTSVVAFGGNCATVLGEVYGVDDSHGSEEGKILILKELARSLGYRISKIPEKKRS